MPQLFQSRPTYGGEISNAVHPEGTITTFALIGSSSFIGFALSYTSSKILRRAHQGLG